MKAEIVKQKDWVYTLLKLNNEYIFVVDFCNQIVDYWISYKLELEEISDEYLAKLAQKITKDPTEYEKFEVETPKGWR